MIRFVLLFITLHRMQGCLVRRKLSVRPFVSPSAKRVHCDKTEKRSVQLFIPYERSFSLVFWEKDRLVGGATPFYLKFWVSRSPCSEIADIEPIFARSASALALNKNSSINTNRKSTKHFSVSLRWILYLAPIPPKGQNGRFPSKIVLCLKKVCYGVSLCENCQRHSCKAFIGLTIRANMIGGGDRFYLKFSVKLTVLERNRRFSIYFHSDHLSRNT